MNENDVVEVKLEHASGRYKTTTVKHLKEFLAGQPDERKVYLYAEGAFGPVQVAEVDLNEDSLFLRSQHRG